MTSSILNFLTGGGAHQVDKAIGAADPIGTAQRQAYGSELMSLVSSPTQGAMDKSPLGSLISGTASSMLGSPALSSMMTPFIQQMTAMDFSTYLKSLMDLSGASQGTQGTVAWDMLQAGRRMDAVGSLMGSAGQALGLLSGQFGGGGGMDFSPGGTMDFQGGSDFADSAGFIS